MSKPYCITSQRDRTVTFDNDAMMTYHYRECHPSYLSSREFWGIFHPSKPVTDFVHPDINRAAERQAVAIADQMSRIVYGKNLQKLQKNNDEDTILCPSQDHVLTTNAEEEVFPEAAVTTDPSSLPTTSGEFSPQTLTVGTDCSGMEAPLVALSNMGINFQHVFSSDIDPVVKNFHQSNFKPDVFFDDIRNRNNRELDKHMDLYVAGFPCQPFSIAGHRRGVNDERGRIVHQVLHHIEHQLPKMFILENVKGFTTIQNGKYVQQTVQFLKQIKDTDGQQAYWVSHKVLNTADHGIPHHRLRWYCVGIIKSSFPNGNNFQFPSSISCPSMDSFLDTVSNFVQPTTSLSVRRIARK